MYYNEIIQELMQDKRNPVNSMYLHEINLKWNNFEKLKEDTEIVEISQLVEALNDFTVSIKNKKYQYNNSTKNGFKPDSRLFSVTYLNDLISLLVKRNRIVEKKGISWKIQSFSTNLKFNPQNLGVMDKDLRFEQELSEKLLCLAQSLDFQFRIKGTRNFKKYNIKFPLIVFFPMKILDESSFIKAEYQARQAKATFERSKSIIVTETIEKKFIPDFDNSLIDALFILRKQTVSRDENPISIEVVEKMDRKITEFLTENETVSTNFIRDGFLYK